MMSSTNEEDPFLQVQSYCEALSQLLQTRQLFTSFLRIRTLTTSPTSPELLSALSELQTALSSITEDLQDLVLSVQAVQSDPYKYGLEIEEVSRRRKLVDDLASEIEDMREELSQGKGKPTSNNNPAEDGRQEEDYTAEFEHRQQLHILAEQDTALDSVFQTVGNLREQAADMGRELEEQAEMLEAVDGLADRVGGRLQTGLKKMGEVVKKNEDGLSSCCIGVLIFVLILLLVLVLVL